jgi:DNA polymerase III delta prime subunit
MCGIVGFCILNKNDIKETLKSIRKYAAHNSWRIRDAVAIGIQEIAETDMNSIIDILETWMNGNDLEKRAIVAALCEPKLLKEKSIIIRIFEILKRITLKFEGISGKLSIEQDSLRKSLGYGWSVAIVSLPYEGKIAFEKIAKIENKHIKWIVKENLKKKRLSSMDKNWVAKMLESFA